MSIRGRRRKRLFVTGGTGFLGSHVVTSSASDRWEVVAPGSGALDLRHRDRVFDMIKDWKPHAVIHTAYRRAERESIVDATHHVAEAAAAIGARLVHVSSDALFAGQLAAYTEVDPPRPVHGYGAAKADAERHVAEIAPSAVIVRTSLIYGSGGGRMSQHEAVVRDAITGAAPMTFFTDEYRSPVRVDDLAAALIELAERRDVSGILHLGGPSALSRAELARLVAHHHDWDADRLRFSTIEESGLTRPGRVVLDSTKARRLGIALRGPGDWRER